jgi:hypothetical protein
MARESREVWVKRVERWQESGLRAHEFAGELGVNAATLAQWKYRLAAEAREGRANAPATEAVEFVELDTTAAPVTPEPARSGTVFELLLPSGIAVRVPSDFDADALRRLVDVMTAP